MSLADAELRAALLATAPEDTLPPVGAISFAVHVRGRTVDEAAAAISQALAIDEVTSGGLLAHLREACPPRSAVVVVDGVDEAADPYRLVVDLLEPLAAAAERTGIRLLVGTRRGGDDGLLRLFGAAALVLDLDAERYRDQHDLAEYVRRTLLAEPDPQVRTPYRTHPGRAATVAAAVAARAGSSFLVAQLTALSLMASSEPVDTGSPGWTQTFPTTVGAAMDRYLRDMQPGGPWLRDLLMALAWSRGDGFDNPRVWAAAATTLGTAAYSEQDVTRLLLDTNAVDLLQRSEQGDLVAFRLFHEALGEHLRQLSARQRSPIAIQRGLTAVLLAQLSSASTDAPDWANADSYTRLHLPHHAGEGQVLDRLLGDAGFLAHTDPARLLAALPTARTESGRQAARLIQRVGQQLLVAPEDERICYLEMAARMAGDEQLAGALAATAPDRPWSVLWAHWDALSESRTLGHHEDYVVALATVETPRGAVVVSASAWGVRAWYLANGEPMAAGVPEPESPVIGMAAYGQGDGIAVVTLHEDGRLLRTTPDATHPQQVLARDRAPYGIWLVRAEDRTAVATVSHGRAIEVLSAQDGHRFAWPRVVIGEEDRILQVDNAGGHCLAVVSRPDGETATWRLNDATPLNEPLRPALLLPGWGPGARVWAASITEREGEPLILLGAQTGHVLAWDPVRAEIAGEPHRGDAGVFVTLFTGSPGRRRDAWSWGDWNGNLFTHDVRGEIRQLAAHDGGIESLARSELNGVTVLVTGGRDGCVRVWDHRTADPAGPAHSYRSIATGVDAAHRDCVASVRADGATVIFDADNGNVLAELPATEEEWRRTLALPSDPSSFITLNSRGHCTLRRFPDARPVRELPTALTELRQVSVSHHAQPILLAPTSSGRLHFVDLTTGEPLRPPLDCHADAFRVAALPEAPQGTLRFITWTYQPREARLWNVTTDETHHLDLPLTPHPDADHLLHITAVAFGRSQDLPVAVAVGSYSHVLIWNTEDGTLVSDAQLEHGHQMELIDVHMTRIAGKPLVATAGHTCSVALWSPQTHQEHHLRIGSVLWHTRFLPGRRVLAAGPRGIMAIALNSRLLDRLERLDQPLPR
ncbi:WD40 repeat domain-containing protein [Streptomyces sp. NPDC046925]|uniref:WD40 repeat domain-containing protein n=1 Tax=Streptomyces sp. NPDC046925 TaxID=3155375 RepID=UPI0033C6833D